MVSSLPSPAAAADLVTAAIRAVHSGQGSRPERRSLTAALLCLEKATRTAPTPIPRDRLLGRWRLCFVAGKQARFFSGQPTGHGLYVPALAIAQLSLTEDALRPAGLTLTNTLDLGPLQVRFTGPAHYPGRRNLLVFTFEQVEVRVGGLQCYWGAVGRPQHPTTVLADSAIASLPFFTFFAAIEHWIAARGRGGGLALWRRVDPAPLVQKAP